MTLWKVKSDHVTSLLKTVEVNPSLFRVIVKLQIMTYRPFMNQPPVNFLTPSPGSLPLTHSLPATPWLHLEYARPASPFGPKLQLFAWNHLLLSTNPTDPLTTFLGFSSIFPYLIYCNVSTNLLHSLPSCSFPFLNCTFHLSIYLIIYSCVIFAVAFPHRM